MPLDGPQIERLAEVMAREWNLEAWTLFAKDHLDIDLAAIAPAGRVETRARVLVLELQKRSKDPELLEKLRDHGNAALKAVANELLTPDFFSPTGDPVRAILLGRVPFVDRAHLRDVVREFTTPNNFSTHVLVVRGEHPCGKSYSWVFLHHLARVVARATPHRLRLEGTFYTPRQMVEQIFSLLRLPVSVLPPMVDDPQRAHVNPLVNAFIGQVATLEERFWLVIDDLNDKTVSKEVRETALALALAVEDSKPPGLWLVLLGYNEEITHPDLSWIAQEDALFPSVDDLAQHFCDLAARSPLPLTSEDAREYADLFIAKYPQLTKGAMTRLMRDVAATGDRLQSGHRP